MSGNQALRKALFMSWSYGYLQGCIDGRPYPAEKDLEPLIALAASEPRQAGETSAPHNCEKLLESEYPSHDQAADGEIWVCGCGKKYVHVCDEAEGCSWTLAEPATPKPREGGAAMLTDTNSPVIKPQSGDTPERTCNQRGVNLPLAKVVDIGEIMLLADGSISAKEVAKAVEFDARAEKMDRDLCRLSIVSTWPTKGGLIEKEYPDRVIDRIMEIVDAYAAGRAASGAHMADEAADHIRCEMSIGGINPKCCELCRAVSEAAPATAQLSEEFLRDVLEITDGHLGKIIRRVAKGEGNKDGLWEHVNRQANALLRSQPAGTEE